MIWLYGIYCLTSSHAGAGLAPPLWNALQNSETPTGRRSECPLHLGSCCWAVIAMYCILDILVISWDTYILNSLTQHHCQREMDDSQGSEFGKDAVREHIP